MKRVKYTYSRNYRDDHSQFEITEEIVTRKKSVVTKTTKKKPVTTTLKSLFGKLLGKK